LNDAIEALNKSIESVAPGFIKALSIYVKTRFNYDQLLMILFEDPTQFYRILVEYLGSEDSANYVFERLIVVPLVLRSTAAYRAKLHEALIESVKRGDSSKALEILKAIVCTG